MRVFDISTCNKLLLKLEIIHLFPLNNLDNALPLS